MRVPVAALCLSGALLLSACDSDGGEETAVANNDSVRVSPGETVTINVLRNDTGSNLTIASFQERSARNGRVTKTDAEELTYRPAAGFLGADSFTYIAQDDAGTESKSAIVTVTVQ